MAVFNPIPDEYPDPDCAYCGGDGIPQSKAHQILAEEWSNKACPRCYEQEDHPNDQ